MREISGEDLNNIRTQINLIILKGYLVAWGIDTKGFIELYDINSTIYKVKDFNSFYQYLLGVNKGIDMGVSDL